MDARAQLQRNRERIANVISNFIASLPTDTEVKMFLIADNETQWPILDIQDAASFYPRMKALSPSYSIIRITLKINIRNRIESWNVRRKLEALARYPDPQTIVRIECTGFESHLGPLKSFPNSNISWPMFDIHTMNFSLSDIIRQTSPVVVQSSSSSAPGNAVLTPESSSSTENHGQASSSSPSTNWDQELATSSTTSNDSVGGYDNAEDSGNDADDEGESDRYYLDAMMAHRFSRARYTIEGDVEPELEGAIGGEIDDTEESNLLDYEVLDISHGSPMECLCETCLSFLQNWHAWQMQGCLFRHPNSDTAPWVR